MKSFTTRLRLALSDRRPRTQVRRGLSVETLEGRSLLSGLSPAMPPHQAGIHALAAASGTVHKAPAFYEFYTGPKNRDLNVTSATVKLVPGRTLTLTGVMQGNIVKKPASSDQESYYVFGIDRGSPKAVTPFFQRPGITFDAVVVVSIEQEGISAFATDLTTGTQTTIDPKSIHISGKTVSVSVNPAIFPTPSGGVSLSQATFNLWPRSDLSNTPQPNHGSFVASFAPEDATAAIGVAARNR